MEILLEEFYKSDIHVDKFQFRKLFLEDLSYQINGITQSGKTKLVKNYLLGLKKSSYLYIDRNDLRIDINLLNSTLFEFCQKNQISTLVLDNYTPKINLFAIKQLIICCETFYEIDNLIPLRLFLLDYEEFLAYEYKYDSSSLNHFFQLGGFAHMHKLHQEERVGYIQRILKSALSDIELSILIFCTKTAAQKISPYSIYERLKQNQKISKDKLYESYDSLCKKGYIYELQKLDHPKAIKKIYLCDISLKPALTIEKHFGRLFENMIYLELLKSGRDSFYDDGIDFYLPHTAEVIIGAPFADERVLFKKIESMEAFLFRYQIKKVTAITMSKEGSLNHPLCKVEIVPFDIWALGD